MVTCLLFPEGTCHPSPTHSTAPGGLGQAGLCRKHLLPRLHQATLQLGAPPLQLLHLLLQRKHLR